MDPYLEGSEWTSIHTALAVEIAQQLTPRLRPKYMARTEKRYVVGSLDPAHDVGQVAATARQSTTDVIAVTMPAGIAVPLTIATVLPERIPLVNVEIRDTADRQLVTAIEIPFPANKHGHNRAEYLKRRQRFLMSAVHLVEIDLSRRGERVPMQRHLPSVPYFAFVGRASLRPLTQVWPTTLRQPLPIIPIPLMSGDPDVPLDVQQALTAVYEGSAYDDGIDYNRPAEFPLDEGDTEWAAKRIADWLLKRP